MNDNNFRHMDDETVLQHYGVKGMKWGVRRGKSKTGVSRLDGAAADAMDNWADYHTKVSNKQKAVATKMGLPGGAGARAEAKAKDYRATSERIKSGKATIEDKAFAYSHVSVASLVVTNRPSGKPSTPEKTKAPKQKKERKPMTKTGQLLKEERDANRR